MRWSFLLSTGLLVGCHGDVCRKWEDARDTCLGDAVASGVEVSDLTWREADCATYDEIYYNDPILGPVLRATAPDFPCMRRAWRQADCTTRAGVEAAIADEATCD